MTTKKKVKSSVVLRGLLHIYGPPGSGKTSLAVTAADPSRTVFLDGDTSKSKYIAEDLSVKEYHNLTALSEGKTEVEHFEAFIKLVDELPDGLDLIIWDEPMAEYNGAHSYVHKNRKLFREQWAPLGPIAGGQEWRIVRSVLLPQLYTKLQAKATLVIICTHEKDDRDDNQVKTGLTIPDADKALRKDAGVVIRLGRNTRDVNSLAPVGLVIKNAGGFAGGKPVPIFPERIAPCDWDKIGGYVSAPISNRTPTEDEIPDEFERSLITGTLNPEQKRVYELMRSLKSLRIEEDMAGDVVTAIATIKKENPDMPQPMLINKVLSDLSDVYDLDKDKIEAILNEAQKE